MAIIFGTTEDIKELRLVDTDKFDYYGKMYPVSDEEKELTKRYSDSAINVFYRSIKPKIESKDRE